MTAESAVKAEPKSHDIRGLKVLVAEDSSITSDLLKLLLDQRGHQVDIVTDGLQALTRCKSIVTTSPCWTSTCPIWMGCESRRRSGK